MLSALLFTLDRLIRRQGAVRRLEPLWVLPHGGCWIVVRLLGNHRGHCQVFMPSGPVPGGEHRATGWLRGCEAGQAGWLGHVGVDRIDATAHEVRLVPEAGATGVLEEILPPPPVRFRTSPRFQLFAERHEW